MTQLENSLTASDGKQGSQSLHRSRYLIWGAGHHLLSLPIDRQHHFSDHFPPLFVTNFGYGIETLFSFYLLYIKEGLDTKDRTR